MSEQSKKLLGAFLQVDVPAHPKSPAPLADTPVAPPPPRADAVPASGSASAKPRAKQPASPAPKRQRRVRRLATADNVKFSQTIERSVSDAFYAVANDHGWTMKDTLSRALKALQSELAKDSKDAI